MTETDDTAGKTAEKKAAPIPNKVKVVFNDDGTDTVTVDGEDIEFGGLEETAVEVKRSLEREGYQVSLVPLREGGLDDFIRDLRSGGDEMIFNLCEGAFDDSGLEMNVAAMIELFDLQFTGSGPLTLAIALNKGLTKDILIRRGVPTAKHVVSEDGRLPDAVELDFPLIVKPLYEDASIGIESGAVVFDKAALDERVNYVFENYEQDAIVEEFLDGREFNVALLGSSETLRALPPSEIDYSDFPEGEPKICGYEAKWFTESPLYIKSPPICPAQVTEELADELTRVAKSAYEALDCLDYARVDMRLGADGMPRVLEVNPNPDISTDAGLARAARAVGFEYHQLIGEIVRLAAIRYDEGEEEDEGVEDDESIQEGMGEG